MKRQKVKVVVYIGVLTLFSLFVMGCGIVLGTDEIAPEIENVVTDLSIVQNDSLTLTLEHIHGLDTNGGHLNLIVLEGDDYTVNGTTVIPSTNFVGDLLVPVQLEDVTNRRSNIDTIIVSVLPDINEIQAQHTGAYWEYNDTFFLRDGDSADESRLEISDVFPATVLGIDGEIHIQKWTNLSNDDSLDLTYLFHSSDSGLIRVGAVSPTDTLIDPRFKLRHPVSAGDSWAFNPLRYNADMGMFYNDTTVDSMHCTNEKVYVTVPAGTFQCAEYSYSYFIDPDNPVTWGPRSSRADVNLVTVKLYYATGVGYVQDLTTMNGQLVKKKVLRNYYVEELL